MGTKLPVTLRAAWLPALVFAVTMGISCQFGHTAEAGAARSVGQYPCTVTRWVDGDTLHVEDVHVFGDIVITHLVVRLTGVDTPEVRGDEKEQGLKATEIVRALAPAGTPVLLSTTGETGNFGRTLGDIILPDGRSVVAELLSQGYSE